MSVREKAVETTKSKFNSLQELFVEDVIAVYEAAMLKAGWKMTPRDSTDAMDDAGEPLGGDDMIWKEMWDAAPSPGDDQ